MSIISGGGAVTGAGGPTGPDPRDYFNTVLYTGDGLDNRAITGVGFQPDWLWVKARSAAQAHRLYDAVRGSNLALVSNSTGAEFDSSADELQSFDTDGFTIDDAINVSSRTYVAWNWKANGAGVSNTAGTITSTVSANTDSGFSIVTYTGNGTGGATVGHGLGVAPSMVILKPRSIVDGWPVYHSAYSATQTLYLHLTNALSTNSTIWNDTAPTSSVFTIGSNNNVNQSTETYVAYCFAEIADFSKFGSYTGNGSATGPSVTTDFEPSFLMIKRTDSTGDWIIHDSARDASNPRTAFLEPNTADAEGSGLDVDFNSTGFQIKSSSATVNANGGTYIYMCIA